MKNASLKVITFLMIGVVFVSSTGFGLIDHTCLMRGETRTTFATAKKSCCPSQQPLNSDDTTLQAQACCEYESKLLVIDLAPVIEKIGQFVSHVTYTAAEFVVHVFQSFLRDRQATLQSADASPPASGKEIIIQKQSLRI